MWEILLIVVFLDLGYDILSNKPITPKSIFWTIVLDAIMLWVVVSVFTLFFGK